MYSVLYCMIPVGIYFIFLAHLTLTNCTLLAGAGKSGSKVKDVSNVKVVNSLKIFADFVIEVEETQESRARGQVVIANNNPDLEVEVQIVLKKEIYRCSSYC